MSKLLTGKCVSFSQVFNSLASSEKSLGKNVCLSEYSGYIRL